MIHTDNYDIACHQHILIFSSFSMLIRFYLVDVFPHNTIFAFLVRSSYESFHWIYFANVHPFSVNDIFVWLLSSYCKKHYQTLLRLIRISLNCAFLFLFILNSVLCVRVWCEHWALSSYQLLLYVQCDVDPTRCRWFSNIQVLSRIQQFLLELLFFLFVFFLCRLFLMIRTRL